MTYHSVKQVLPILKANCSQTILFIGNNANPDFYEETINQDLPKKKNILFGFTGIGGSRKKDRIISMHPLTMSLRIGGLHTLPSQPLQQQLESSFKDTSCQIGWEPDMQGWLLTHLAFILPTTYICYHHDFHLFRVKKATMLLMLDAVQEAHAMLKENGYQIRPEGEDRAYVINRKQKLKKLQFLFKTPAGKFVISNHCKHGVKEMMELDENFQMLCEKANLPMPVWNALRNLSQPAKDNITL